MKENFQPNLETEPVLRKFQTLDGGTIEIPLETEEHLLAHPEIKDILPEVISKIQLPIGGEFLATEVDMGRILGRSACVETPRVELNDKVLFANRINRFGPTRVLVDAEGPETSKVTVLAAPNKEKENTYLLFTAYVGSLAPMEPWDSVMPDEQLPASLDFWRSHALVWDKEIMSEPFESTWAEVLEKYRNE